MLRKMLIVKTQENMKKVPNATIASMQLTLLCSKSLSHLYILEGNLAKHVLHDLINKTISL